jgi:threonine dehydrogenase-like Zn-dependent dehydrogenase
MSISLQRSSFSLILTSTLALSWMAAIALSANAQTFSKTFTVSPESSQLEVVNRIGAIRVTAIQASAGKIIVNARLSNDAKINAIQTPQGSIKVEVSGRGVVDFDITVPITTNLDLLSYKGAISVTGVSGPIRARTTTEGDIVFNTLRSPIVEAHSASGNVRFNGEILPSGNYTLKSFSGKVEATLPASADFKLFAASYRHPMDFDGFAVKFDKKSDQVVEGAHGQGRATLNLWTQEGSIQLHRRP